jgi:carbon storage regulator
MLVISRKPGESLVISEKIKITVISLGNDKVSIGIDAPREVKIVREELMETIEANKAASVSIDQTEYKGIAALLRNRNKVD